MSLLLQLQENGGVVYHVTKDESTICADLSLNFLKA